MFKLLFVWPKTVVQDQCTPPAEESLVYLTAHLGACGSEPPRGWSGVLLEQPPLELVSGWEMGLEQEKLQMRIRLKQLCYRRLCAEHTMLYYDWMDFRDPPQIHKVKKNLHHVIMKNNQTVEENTIFLMFAECSETVRDPIKTTSLYTYDLCNF